MHENTEFELDKNIELLIKSAIIECCPLQILEHIEKSSHYKTLIKAVADDAATYSKKDPASKDNVIGIIKAYTSFKAVFHYRIANFIYKNLQNEDVSVFASLISHRGKILSGSDIHYKAEIGDRFVLDHGYGTVIGETSNIGEDCYILGGVVLGATGISGNPDCRRHPKIGDRVEIGAFSSIFGDINIGNDVFIGQNCIITENIPSNSRVIIRTKNQVINTLQEIKR